MANFEIKGELVAILDEQVVSDKFKKREFVIQTADQYPQVIKFQLTQDRCGMIDSYRKGETITVNFDVKGKEYVKGSETMYFNSLEAWKITGANGAPKSQSGKDMTKVADLEKEPFNDEPFDLPSAAKMPPKPNQDLDDLPF